jgi:hypothetical protein
MLIKTINRPPKKIIRKVQIQSTEHFVRDAGKIYRRIAEVLSEIAQERRNRAPTSESMLVQWERKIRFLATRTLADHVPIPAQHLLTIITWYRDHYDDDQFIPEVESGWSLTKKFDRLEDAWRKRTKFLDEDDRELTSQQVFKQKGFDSTRVIDSLVKDIMRPAQKLKLIDIKNEGQLAAKIADLYHSIEDERNAANMPNWQRLRFGGPLSILRDYIKWLEEQRWEASSNVLLPDSRAFAAFRRDFRSLELFDPINGRD